MDIEEGLRTLPRWARVAFAARCARRVQRYLTQGSSSAEIQKFGSVTDALEISERAAAEGSFPSALHRDLPVIFATTAAYAAKAAAAAAEMEAATDGADYDGVDTDAQIAWQATAEFATAAHSAACKSIRAARLSYRSPEFQEMLNDFELLRSTAQRQQWTDDTRIPATFFGRLPTVES